MIVNIDSIKLLCFMRIENTKDFKHERRIEKENMKEGIIKRNSINKWMK